MTPLLLSPDSAALHEEELKPASNFNYLAIVKKNNTAQQDRVQPRRGMIHQHAADEDITERGQRYRRMWWTSV